MCTVARVSIAAMCIAGLTGISASQATTRVQKQFGNWLIDCVEPENQQKRCTLSQTFRGTNRQNNQRVFVFSWAVSSGGDGAEKATFRTPLGVELQEKLQISFPGSEPLAVDFAVCNRRGCFGEYEFTEGWVVALQRNETAKISYQIRNGNQMSLEMELDGFSEAYEFYKAHLAQ